MVKPSLSHRLQQAKAAQRQGDLTQARAIWADILRDYPGHAAAQAALAALPRPTAPAHILPPLTALLRQNQPAAAVTQAAALLRLYPDDPGLWTLQGHAQRALGQTDAALRSFRTAADLAPHDPKAAFTLALSLHRAGHMPQALQAYRSTLELQPDHPQAMGNLGVVLHALGQYDQAIIAHRAARTDPAEALYNLALSLRELGQTAKAVAANRAALALNPAHARAANNLGLILQEQGDPAAPLAFRQALTAHPTYTDAFLNLVQSTRLDPADPLLTQMQTLYASGTLGPADLCPLAFALARLHDQTGALDQAFACLAHGNALRKAQLRYDIAQDRTLFATLRQTAPQIDGLSPPAASPQTPIFIVGMPRSGTTLVEQIVSSHPDITGAGELDFVRRLGGDMAQGRTEASQSALHSFRDGYLARINALSDRPFVTDKMPHNFLFLPLIVKAFPQARILHVRRDPAATCWSNYSRKFTSGRIGYAYDLHDLVAYHQMYDDLMQHWSSRYPDRILQVNYDDLTADPASETRRLIASLGLDWSDACLAPQSNNRAVQTASNLQIRQPVYQGSSQSWRRYLPWIDDAFAALA